MIRTRSASADAGGAERDDPELLAGRAGGSAEPPQHRDDAGQEHQRDQDDAAAEQITLDVRPGIDGVPVAVDAVRADEDEPDHVQARTPPTRRGRPSATGPTGTCPPGTSRKTPVRQRQRHRPSEERRRSSRRGGPAPRSRGRRTGAPRSRRTPRRARCSSMSPTRFRIQPIGCRGWAPRMTAPRTRAAEAREVDERPAVDAGRPRRQERVRRHDQRRVDDGQEQR